VTTSRFHLMLGTFDDEHTNVANENDKHWLPEEILEVLQAVLAELASTAPGSQPPRSRDRRRRDGRDVPVVA
jgi:hypothetical protein